MTLSSTNKKRVKELYFYKTESGEYKIELIDLKRKPIEEDLKYSTRLELNAYIENLQAYKNTKYQESHSGMMIYNRRPSERLLTKTFKKTECLFESYVYNLDSLKENSFYRHKVATLLRTVSDILDGDAPEEPCCPSEEPIEMGVLGLGGVTPEAPISPEISEDLIQYIEESLTIELSREDLTFWFQDQRFQLTKDIYSHDTPEPQKPKTSHNIQSTLDFIGTLLRVNHEMIIANDENSIRFTKDFETYRIQHIYTGDHNTLPVGSPLL